MNTQTALLLLDVVLLGLIGLNGYMLTQIHKHEEALTILIMHHPELIVEGDIDEK